MPDDPVVPDLRGLVVAMCDAIAGHAEELTALDGAIGDGDHGLNMRRGFEAVRAEAGTLEDRPFPEALKAIGTKLVMTVGGASGPLYGTLFLALGKEWPSEPSRETVTMALEKAVQAVAARGKSQAGQKTMLDVLFPVLSALKSGAAIAGLAVVADDAAEATAAMKAIRGRASFLGDRSVGHIDPGARSCALLIRAVAGQLGTK